MAFTWKRPEGRLYSYEDGARLIISVGQSMGVSPKGCVMAISCVKVESDFWIPGNPKDPAFNANRAAFKHDSLSNDGLSSGWYQQQMSAAGVRPAWGWGGLYGDPEGTRKRMDPVESSRLFFAALLKQRVGNRDYNTDAKSPGIWVADVQQCAPQFRGRYDQEWQWAQNLYNRVATTDQVPPRPVEDAMLKPGPWTGDPIWLDEVLIAEGLNVKMVPGWDRDGHGDFKDVRGVICHHTGGNNTPVSEIVNGFSHLPGPLAQIHLGRDGTVTLVCVGVAWHAGTGGAPWLPRSMANWHTIGIEAVGLPPRNGRHREGWPDVQYDAYVKCCAAICRRLGVNADRVLSHQEWDDGDPATDEGKWDPGSIDMKIMRADVQRRIESFSPTGEVEGFLMALNDAEQRRLLERTDAIYGALFNPVVDTSIYGSGDPNHKISNKDRLTYMDGNVWDQRVEYLAKTGVSWAVEAVVRAAAGRGPRGDDKNAVDQAKDLLQELDDSEVLDEWAKKFD